MRLTRIAIAAAALTAAGTLAAPAAFGGAHAARSAVVSMKNITFHPHTLTIHRGQTVTWVFNDGSTPHNVISSHFKSPTKSHGTFSVHFTHSGTYSYYCSIHPGMAGKVVVR